MKFAQKAAAVITLVLCVLAASFFQDSANKEAFFLREFGVPVSEIHDLKAVQGGGLTAAYSSRRFRCERPLPLKNASDFHEPYNRKWKDDPAYVDAFLKEFPEDQASLADKDQLECLEVSFKNASGELRKTLLINKAKNLYWYRLVSSS